MQGKTMENAKESKTQVDYNKRITDDYECTKDCRDCPFPGAKCYPTKYDRYNTGLLIHKQ